MLLFLFNYLVLVGIWDHTPCIRKAVISHKSPFLFCFWWSKFFLSLNAWSSVKVFPSSLHPITPTTPPASIGASLYLLEFEDKNHSCVCSLPELKHRLGSQGNKYKNSTLLLITLNWRTWFGSVTKWTSNTFTFTFELNPIQNGRPLCLRDRICPGKL